MATKEEHRKAIESVRRERMGEVMISIVEDAEGCWAEALAERDVAREELRTFQDDHAHAVMARASKSAQPAAESAPVVGGVTEAMLDEIESAFPGEWDSAINAARDATRKQKRVDVEAIREVAANCYADTKDKLLRAIGDEPAAEAPASVPKSEAKLFHGIPVYVDPACPPNKLYFAAGPLDGPTGPNSFAAIVDIKPASPAPEPATVGTFSWSGFFLLRDGEPCGLDDLAPILNAGLEAEKRVAELERDRDGWKLDAQLRARNEGVQKARADAAEKRVAELETAVALCHTDIASHVRERAAEKARADAAEKDRDAAWEQARYTNEALNTETEKRKDAERKLAALGENPIRRELVERWQSGAPIGTTRDVALRSILSGLQPWETIL